MMSPDGFVSSVIASESFSDIKVLLHGPVGCRKDMSFISSILCPKKPKADSKVYRTRYYVNNPRVPCTEVEAEDYISGAIFRLEDALSIVSKVDDDIIAVVNTPGVSLIGDNCEDLISKMGLQDRALAMDADYISIPVGEGYDRTLVKLMRWLKPEKKETQKGTVNIIGLSLFTRDWKGVLDDLTELLEAMGLSVMCSPGAKCSSVQFKESVNAEFNVAVCSEYCSKLKELYAEYGVPTVDIHEAPVGFDAVRKWIMAVAEHCGADPSKALSILEKTMIRAHSGMSSSRMGESLRGKTLGIAGDSTIVLPMVRWLYEYLAMIPTYVRLTEGYDETAKKELESFLDSIGCAQSLNDDIPESLYMMASDGDTVCRMELGRICTVGLDIGYPSLYDSNFMKKNVIGHNGALYILERTVNGRPLMTM